MKTATHLWLPIVLLAHLPLSGCRSTTPGTTATAPPSAETVAPVSANSSGEDAEAQEPYQEPYREPVEEGLYSADTEPRDEIVDPVIIQQEALELCQSAAILLDSGDVDEAIGEMDRAYELMLQLPNNGDQTYLQAKEDIRLLVVDLVSRAYQSRRTGAHAPSTSWDLAISVAENEHVKREIKSFTAGESSSFLEGYRRSGLYRPMILRKLSEAGLPSQLSWMPLVESWFKVRALSRASALGMWQFIHSTGLRYGLKRDSWVDERMDPEKSTDAAIAYLTELHEMFGDWPKALAAYNCGEARVMRLTRNSSGEYVDFWDIYPQLPGETRRYVPRFLASLLIIDNPEKYGVALPDPLPAMDGYDTATVERAVRLEQIEKSLDLPTDSVKNLNPELRHWATPKSTYSLKVPAGSHDRILATIGEVPEWKPPQEVYGTHVVRKGESLYVIARRYRTSVTQLKRINNLRSNLIRPGQKLRVRGSVGGITVDGKYQVRQGDTLSRIAQAHGVGLSALLNANALSTRSTIYPGQWIAIPE